MTNRDFLNNNHINESNSLPDLMQSMDPEFEDEVSIINHSLYYDEQGFRNTVDLVNGKLRILNLNCAGLNAKFDKIKLFLASSNNNFLPITIITLQETHLKENANLEMYDLPEYTLISDHARINQFGGVAIYLHNSFSHNRLPIIPFNQNSTVYESMLIEIYNNYSKHDKYIIGNVYRRPHDRTEELSKFINEFTEVLHNVDVLSKRTYFCADFNIDLLLLKSNHHYNTFYENITAQGFFPKITRPTRSSGDSHTLIDNIITNNIGKPHTAGILITPPVSDHYMHFCILEGISTAPTTKTTYVEIEQINANSIENLRKSVRKAEIMSKLDISPNGDPNNNYDILMTVLVDSKRKHIPKKRKKFDKRKHSKEKWMTTDLLSLVNTKNELYRSWKSENNNEEFMKKRINFKTFERIVEQSVKDAKNKYYYETFLSQKNDMKKTWATINDTLHRKSNKTDFPREFMINNNSVTDHTDIANHFNHFYSNIGANLCEKIIVDDVSLHYQDYLINPTNKRFKFNQVSVSETLYIINKLENKKSCGNDEFSNKLIKSLKDEISEPLTIIINQSLNTGVFPDKLKVAKVKPLFKKGDKACLNNYRPISLLPTISKIFERVLYNQLYHYFNINNLLAEQQYGFRPQHSTELATIKLVDTILANMDNTKVTKTPVSIFMDLSKAFDTLSFPILLTKLAFYGISGIPLDLIKSYFTNRCQYVNYIDSDSSLTEIKMGIPQGSILGPLFFSIYINDLVKSSNMFSFLMYADDTTIYFNLEDFPNDNIEQSINNELEKVNTWLKLNALTLNVDKTKCMWFHKRREVNPMMLTINNRQIDTVTHFSFLGVILDVQLSWKNHIDMITNKLSKIIGILHRMRYIFPQRILLTIYNSLFVPHINFGSLVWGANIKRIGDVQKKAIRIITHSGYIAHTEPLLKELNLLKAKDMFNLKILNFLYKLAIDTLPPYFDIYRPHLAKIVTPYSLRPHPLPAPPISHVYAESCLVYQLVSMKNNIAKEDELILDKLENKTHSYSGFSKYVTLKLIEKYKYDCTNLICRTCNRP